MRPDTVGLVTGGAALIAVALPGSWRVARNVITIVHEAGHALAAVLVGRRLHGIRLHSDTSGLTVSRGRHGGPGMVCTTLAGYPAPSLLGLAFAGLVAADLAIAPLVASAVLLTGVLIMVRNAYGVLSVLVTAAVLVTVSSLGSPATQAGFAQLIAWFLLFGGLRPIAELQRQRWRGHARYSDADQLARLTGAPGAFWVGAFALIGTATLAVAAGWLLA